MAGEAISSANWWMFILIVQCEQIIIDEKTLERTTMRKINPLGISMTIGALMMLAACTSTPEDAINLPEKIEGQVVNELKITPSNAEEFSAVGTIDQNLGNASAIDADGDVLLVLHGSSTCPPDPSVTAVGNNNDEEINRIDIATKESEGICTKDYVPAYFKILTGDFDVVDNVTISVDQQFVGEVQQAQ
jgi:hypothetical protein